MIESLRVFENSLRDYLINVMSDAHNTFKQINNRYNNLKIYMDVRKSNLPHFCVGLGISEVCYDLENLGIISGSIGPDERYISRWASRPNINGELRKHWSYISKTNVNGKSIGASEELEEKLRLADIDTEMVKLTGTGTTRKFVGFESNIRKLER